MVLEVYTIVVRLDYRLYLSILNEIIGTYVGRRL